mmetsp:Transcript_48391/g.117528  ORF Transcript_48391/g.117528 Transcript_48391/m.117528 type:complete len:93 (-) Transcript_48391:138-416(-)
MAWYWPRNSLETGTLLLYIVNTIIFFQACLVVLYSYTSLLLVFKWAKKAASNSYKKIRQTEETPDHVDIDRVKAQIERHEKNKELPPHLKMH